jgi:hypothetical protein
MTSGKYDGYVVMDSDVLDQLYAAVCPVGIEHAIDEIDDVMENLVDAYQGIPYSDGLRAAGVEIQGLFDELAVVLPVYIDVLAESVRKFGAETYVDEAQTKYLLGVDRLDSQLFAKLQLGNGTRAFTLLQIAGWKAKVGDDHVRLWYPLLQLFLGNAHQDKALSPLH